MNELGLITVYAKDIALLPEWQQRIWASYNVSPDGGISKELHASQVLAEPARTVAPEPLFAEALQVIDAISIEKFGFSFILKHASVSEILPAIHRFRALDRAALFYLAKDVARVIVDNIDASALQKVVAPPKGTKWGSIKSLENLVALGVGDTKARAMLGPIAGIYKLRHADAHLPGSDVDQSLALVRVDQSAPVVVQGFQLLKSDIDALGGVARTLKNLRRQDVPKS
jgi:hypothetical protein